MVAAGYVLYGPSVLLLLATPGSVTSYTLDPTGGAYRQTASGLTMPADPEYYSANEGYVGRWSPGVLAALEVAKRGRSARYVGSLVSDFHRNLVRGGVFLYPADEKNPGGKLRARCTRRGRSPLCAPRRTLSSAPGASGCSIVRPCPFTSARRCSSAQSRSSPRSRTPSRATEMSATLTVATAGLGAIAGEGEVPAEVLAAVEDALAGTTLDATRVFASSGVVAVMVRHGGGEDDPDVHRQLWEAFRAGGDAARERGLHLAARDLLADALPSDGLLGAAGPAVAELTFEPREAESVVVLLAPGASVGSLNAALYRAFADPLNTSGLVRSAAMQAGFVFEVHDLRERRKAVFQTPAEAYALLAHLDESERYVLEAHRQRRHRRTGRLAGHRIKRADARHLDRRRHVARDRALPRRVPDARRRA